MVKYGYASNVDEMVDRLKFDLLYIENMSLLVDFKILIYLIKMVLVMRIKITIYLILMEIKSLGTALMGDLAAL
jgi:lipopolysaccharide/colanic/teichoic acid biosynthesis glycosyltransferase